MARYPQNSKIRKALLSSDANVKKAKRTQYGAGTIAPKAIKELSDLFRKKEDAKKIYNRVEKWLNDQKLSEEVLMPSFSEFAQGKKPNVTISGIDIPMAQLEQATYVKDPVVSDIVTKLGLDSNPVDEILNFMRKK